MVMHWWPKHRYLIDIFFLLTKTFDLFVQSLELGGGALVVLPQSHCFLQLVLQPIGV